MNIGIILMSGNGTRMNSSIPKQYLEINKKPLFIYAIENFLKSKMINNIILVINKEWEEFVNKKINDFIHKDVIDKIYICYGSTTRNKSIVNAIKFCKNNLMLDDESIILTHDAARIFVSKDIIENNISVITSDNETVVSTSIKATDTISEWCNNKISKFIDRNFIYIHQTPQSSTLRNMIKICECIEREDLDSTDIISIANDLKMNIVNVNGNYSNFKITTISDFKLAEDIIKK